MIQELLALAVLLAACSGVPALLSRGPGFSSGRVSAALLVLACGAIVALAALGTALDLGAFEGFSAWAREAAGWLPRTELGLDDRFGSDPLQRWFLVPIAVLGGLSAVFGLRYWSAVRHPHSAGRVRFFLGTLVAGMLTVVAARDAFVLLVGWEAMALSAFFLIGTEDHRSEVRAAAWLYLAATHLSSLALLALFAVWHASTGSFALDPNLAIDLDPTVRNVLFVLALVGFGTKAGLWPLHFWLPTAHAQAPGHVSALLSGVLVKVGFYGLVRVTWLLGTPSWWWGAVLIALGLAAATFGIATALGQTDLKRLLAYSTVKNVGILAVGLGTAELARSFRAGDIAALALGGALLHVWTHAAGKGLLFFAASAAVQGTGTQTLDALGGLSQRMPRTALAFLVGALSISGLPPFAGFASEWLVFMSLLLLSTAPAYPVQVAASIGVAGLALVGALGVGTFVKAYGIPFLGQPRGASGAYAHDPVGPMAWPLGVLAGACIGLGLATPALSVAIDLAFTHWAGVAAAGPLRTLAPLPALAGACLALAVLVGIVALVLRRRIAQVPVAYANTWDCGYVTPSARMQYTAASFSQATVEMFGRALATHHRPPRLEGFFPARATLVVQVTDIVLDRVLAPALRRIGQALAAVRVMQSGRTQAYFLYMLVLLVVLLLWRP